MRSFRDILQRVRQLPRRDRALFYFATVMFVWQCMYLVRFFGDTIYYALEVPVTAPSKCEVPKVPEDLSLHDLGPGDVRFRVDTRCIPPETRFNTVYVTSPFCGECGPERWNELSDEDGDGIWTGTVNFSDPITDEPYVGVGLQYRYGIRTFTEDGSQMHYPEVLVGPHSDRCAPASDGATYAYRVLVTDVDGALSQGVFGTCVSVPIGEEDWKPLAAEAWKDANPFLAKKVDPWWKPISAALRGFEVFNPILFLTFCSLTYIYAIYFVGTGYVNRKEAALQQALNEARHKNTYLEHAAKILRHDMHSGINTYIPRGISSLERRLTKDPDCVKKLRLDAPMRMLKEGLAHAQKVYAGVTEFTNLVKAGAEIEKQPHDLREILTQYLDTTGYKSEVIIGELPTIEVNAPLFCTAIDNLIRNGLKYNDSPSRMVVLTMVDEDHLGVIDNGRGMTQEEFLKYSAPYSRKAGQQEGGTGLGLNICIAILHEHGFAVTAEKRPEGGTLIRVNVS